MYYKNERCINTLTFTFLVQSTGRLFSKMTYYLLSETLKPAHLLTLDLE